MNEIIMQTLLEMKENQGRLQATLDIIKDLAMRTNGRVTVLEGDRIKAGAVLATLSVVISSAMTAIWNYFKLFNH